MLEHVLTMNKVSINRMHHYCAKWPLYCTTFHRKAMALEVQVIESSFVAPSEAMPHKGLWVSSLDLSLANRGYTPTVYFYRSAVAATANLSDVAARLKESLAKALVAFYPFAGRVGVGDDGRTQINCNSKGALFVVAGSELTVDDIIDLMPSTELRRRFVPHIEPPSVILAIQVSFKRPNTHQSFK